MQILLKFKGIFCLRAMPLNEILNIRLYLVAGYSVKRMLFVPTPIYPKSKIISRNFLLTRWHHNIK